MSVADLLSQTDHCVLCGLCSQHCPTYALSRDENESPRGRISLIAALSRGQIPMDAQIQGHLDHCLLCRACERHCPSAVNFGRIMDEARAAFLEPEPDTGALSLLRKPLKMRRLAPWLNLYQRSGLQRLARGSGLLKALELNEADALLAPAKSPRWKTYFPAHREQRGDVALFTGCISETFDSDALEASIKLLTRLGYGVHVPERQACCGALDQHGGRLDEAASLAQQNLNAFASLDIQAIVHTASGCTAMLREYDKLGRLDEPSRILAQGFSPKVMDISQFLVQHPWPDDVNFKPLAHRVAVHDPCTLSNVLRQADKPYTLLSHIPELELAALLGNHTCCGAAGTFMLTQPALARQLRSPKITAIRDLGVQHVLTSNVGCALHLRAGLRESGLDVEVLHPVTLLARQLEG